MELSQTEYHAVNLCAHERDCGISFRLSLWDDKSFAVNLLNKDAAKSSDEAVAQVCEGCVGDLNSN